MHVVSKWLIFLWFKLHLQLNIFQMVCSLTYKIEIKLKNNEDEKKEKKEALSL